MESRTQKLSRRSYLATMTIACLVFLAGGCDRQPAAQPNDGQAARKQTNRIVAVSYPLQYLTKRIAGDSIDVSFPVDVDGDPQNWRPSREAIGKMQAADLVIANGTGATYAKWLATVSLADSKIRNTASRGLALADFIAVKDIQVVHSHGPEGEHSHPTMVARTWLDPAIAKKQAVYIAAELKSVYPDLASVFESNLKSLTSDLDQLSELISSIKPDDTTVVVTATPELKFFTRAAGLEDRHLNLFEAPTAETAESDLEKALASEGTKPNVILFCDTEPGAAMLELLSNKNLQAISVDLIDRKPDNGDFISALRRNIDELSRALK